MVERVNMYKEKKVSNKLISNHLTKGYSSYVFKFISKHYINLNIDNTILDVGCGNYRNLKLFEKLGFNNLNGFDRNDSINPLSVKVNFTKGNLEDGLPYEDTKFDIVLCNFVLMFIKNYKMTYVLDELMRVCKDFIIIETYRAELINSSGIFYEDYSFNEIANYIEKKFKIINRQNYNEKLIARRK